MKSLFFTICFIAGIVYNAQSQKMAAQLQSKKWYVNGNVGKGALTLKPTQGKTPSDWEAKFSSTGNLHNCSTLKNNVIDATGIEVKAGTMYCDSFYLYKVKNDVVSIQHMADVFYYKIKALPNSEGIELAPATKDDFK
ncbi:MAG TPA: hypothetical protein VN026_15675 [Bacteroidia bacterium]|jgi:hypothetical protein|nr:hypothetical protein [Bacteroidia bacterium]